MRVKYQDVVTTKNQNIRDFCGNLQTNKYKKINDI